MRQLHEINKERFALMHTLSREFAEKNPNLDQESARFEHLHNEYVQRDPRIIALNMEAKAAWEKAQSK